MKAKVKNTLTSWVVGFPIMTYFPINTWQFWFIGMVAFQLYLLATVALPVFVDRVPRKDGR